MEEEEVFTTPNTVCTGCPGLEKKSVFTQNKISWRRRSKINLEGSNPGVSKVFQRRATLLNF